MKKSLSFILVLLFLGLMVGCAKKTTTIKETGNEVLLDKNMENGVGVMGTVSITDLKTIYRYFRYSGTVNESVKPVWRLAQWGTRYDLKDTGVESIDGDFYVLSDETKEFKVNPKTGEYQLNASCALEYPTPRKYGESWLHLIVEESISDVSRVDEMSHIWADLDFEVTLCDNLMGSDYNPNLHSALFQWVFIVKNDNQDSPDYGQYMWVNIPYFDNRYDFEAEGAFMDFGKEDKSNTFIYSASGESILDNVKVEIGKRRRVNIDLITYIDKALTTIQGLPENSSSSFPILLNTTLADLRIESFYIGWECPGTFNASLTVYSQSLRYEMK